MKKMVVEQIKITDHRKPMACLCPKKNLKEINSPRNTEIGLVRKTDLDVS
jgi:antitoxin (DNA-binding transcriptional repressor) of toxin-antitoxin stability system